VRIPTNKVKDIRRFMRQELEHIYDNRTLAIFADTFFIHFAGFKAGDIYVWPEKPVSESVLLKINNAIKLLKEEVPLEYITGKAEFFGLTLGVNKHVLIPRPETEEMVKYVQSDFRNTSKLAILDACTGSGCIAIALKKYFSESLVHAFDVSNEAINIATINAQNNDAAINFYCEDLLSPTQNIDTHFIDVLTCNPPYVRESDKVYMKKNVLAYEPQSALFVSDANPLVFYNALAEYGKKVLLPNGVIYCEINENLGRETAQIFEKHNYKKIQILKDFNSKERFIKCLRPAPL